MKTIQKIILMAILLLAVSFSARAQRGFDCFGVPRTLTLGVTNLLLGSPANGIATMQVADIHTFDGIAVINGFSWTNAATAGWGLTVLPQVSNDNTNWSSATNWAFIGSTTAIAYTNNYYGQGTNNFYVNDYYLLPGSIVTPAAYSAGFATPYLNTTTVAFTNTAAVAVSNGVFQIGINIGDQPRYLRVLWNASGNTATNWTVGATFTGVPNYPSYPF